MRVLNGSVLFCLVWCLGRLDSSGQPVSLAEHPLKLISPAEGAVLDSFLTAVLRWEYPQRPESVSPSPFLRVNLQVADNPKYIAPLANVDLDDHQTSYRVALVPEKKYYWRLTPFEEANGVPKYYTNLRAEATFSTGKARNQFEADDSIRYQNPREGAHWQSMRPVVPKLFEPLSPWYEVKAYKTVPPPSLNAIKGQFPVPVWDGHPEALAAYWYCWDTLLRVWVFAPKALDHQAVANLLGYPTWGHWGSTMVFDSCVILHFSRFGAAAYPFITCLDNCYARQHENGFICRESDRENREVYVVFPVNPPLFAWAEWEWYKATNDKERLRRILLPLVKHYEWWMTYQRRENGLYWVHGFNEADDSPRNELMYYSASATSYQGLAALYLSKIAQELGRADLKSFFDQQHEEIKALVNARLWDAQHQIYNDLTKDGKFITELQPGVLCKHVHMFWPLMAELTPPNRLPGIIAELKNPASFNRSSGIPSLSADSKGYNAENGQYWKGAVWPSAQCMVQEGLVASGQQEFLQEITEKYYNACLKAYRNQGTITENLAPDKPMGFGARDFVGWGGIGPVANLIEHILGFDINAPANTITWHISRLERHGLERLQLGGFKADMICEARSSPGDACHITINSGGSFVLKVLAGSQRVDKEIHSGTQSFVIPSNRADEK
jgi:hypothetical protein